MGRDSPENAGRESDPVALYDSIWAKENSPPDLFSFLKQHPHLTPAQIGELLLLDQQRRQETEQPIRVEEYAAMVPGILRDVILELAAREFGYLQARGENHEIDSFLDRFPDLAGELRTRLLPGQCDGSTLDNPIEAADINSSKVWAEAIGPAPAPGDHPKWIGKYPIARLLDKGKFKLVYLSHHPGLDIDVVIKVPHPHLVSTPDDVDSFLEEAQVLARLDHPGIVKVYDAGVTDDGLCYVVEKFIEETNLGAEIQRRRFTPAQAAALAAAVAEALHHVHISGLVHRDIKPANILIDRGGRPIVTDFGLVLKREDFGKGHQQPGTPAYMSPEQARGEGHLVDGRSDIYSLGVVLFQLLTGRLPFIGEVPAVLEQIRTAEVCPPRQIDDAIPCEIERICLKALSKRVLDRYSTAIDLARELRDFAEQLQEGETGEERDGEAGGWSISVPRIVPKGLRSFDSEDADFFLDLLPGPRDREGLPESIRSWKLRIEEADSEKTFRVGLIYGPSGCGKSSLVKAGLLPRLDARVRSVLIESTPDGTEERLLRGLRRKLPELDLMTTISEMMTAIRRRKVPAGEKVLVVIDQFEQWLHGRALEPSSELIWALRQCDGERLQCLLLVRDDFWMGVTRFMHQVEIPLVEGQSSAAVDLFDRRHSRRVLEAFGRAYQALPAGGNGLAKEQASFLDQAVEGLVEEGAVIPVRLALFAQMVKDRDWSPGTFKSVGGTLGVGVAFLEETFSSPHAPPEHRLHQKAARAVLRALLPEQGSVIKGHMRSHRELRQASGLVRRPKDFEELIRILDREVRLLAPVDFEGIDGEREEGKTPGKDRCYQLTHDYLVPALREWLTRKQRETIRGRAELRLTERSDFWNANPKWRLLPSLWEWLDILLLTRWMNWTLNQKRMMSAAGKYHLGRIAFLVFLTGLIFFGKGLWTDWTVRKLVQSARSSWEQGSSQWGEMCRSLDRAQKIEPNHQDLVDFLRKISSEGALIIHTVPEDVEIEIAEDFKEAQGGQFTLPLDCPRLLAGGKSIQSGEMVPLKLGHYRVVVTANGQSWEFPIFIGQVRFEKGPKSWQQAEDPVIPREVTEWSPAIRDPARFLLAEEQEIKSLKPPKRIPPDFAFIPPGFSWCSRILSFDGAVSIEGEGSDWKKGLALQEEMLMRVYLDAGFIICKDETSVGEFEAWLERYQAEPFLWHGEERAQQFLAGTSCLLFKELKSAWELDDALMGSLWSHAISKSLLKVAPFKLRKDIRFALTAALQADGINPGPIDRREALCLARGWFEGRGARNYRQTLLGMLGKVKNKRLPVSQVNSEVALLYARTHAGTGQDQEEILGWLSSEIRKTNELVFRLGALEQNLHQKMEPLLKRSEIPVDIKISESFMDLYNFSEQSLISSYVLWLSEQVRFSRDLPVDSIRQWSRMNPKALGGSLSTKLPELERMLENPLHELRKGEWDTANESPCLSLVLIYGAGLREEYESGQDNSSIDRENFIRWLQFKGTLLKDRLRRMKDILKDRSIDIPWDLRLQFGFWQGWNLPNLFQWEKAFRGADCRKLPWGSKPEYERAWLGPDPQGPSTRDRDRVGGDVSPYDVWGMAGNLSEFVLKPPVLEKQKYQIIKGGNFNLPPMYSNIDYTLFFWGLDRNRFTGFRVIQEIRDQQE